MWEGILFYFQRLITDTLIFRVAVISFALAFVLTPPERNVRSIGWFLVRFFALMVVRHLLSAVVEGILYCVPSKLEYYLAGEFGVNLLICVLYTAFFCRYDLKRKLIYAGTLMAVIWQTVNLSYSFGTYIDLLVDGWTIPVLLITYSLILIFAFVSTRYSIAKFVDFPRGGFILLFVTDVLGIGMTLFTQVLSTMVYGGIAPAYTVGLFTFLYVFLLIAYVSVYMICDKRDRMNRTGMENVLLRAQSEQLQLTRENIEALRMMRHDIKNKYAYIDALLDRGEYGKIKEMASSFSTRSLKPDFYIDCGNHEVSSILTMESTKANNNSIGLDCTVMLPSELPFAVEDVCSILTNLIDNAIESNLRYGIRDDIKVIIYLRKEQFYVCIRNRVPDDADPKKLLSLRTSKKNRFEHGLGTKIVERVAKKYNGDVVFDVEDGEFIAEVVLDMFPNRESR